MARDLFNRYIWLVDTIRRYGRLTRAEIDECWRCSSFSENGTPMPRRTFANYRQAAQEMFKIDIVCDPTTYEYYIDGEEAGEGSVTEWLLNSAMTNDALANSRDIASRIILEEVPSAREFLAPVIDALRHMQPVSFDYHSYSRMVPTPGVVLEPYFLKLFRQRWYLTGRNRAQNRIKTYALDRMSHLHLLPGTFVPDPAFDVREYSRHSFGIVFDGGEPRHIVLRVEPRQAKYFRDLPLHHSQEEYVHDCWSLFHYDMRVTPDLVDELLSHVPRVVVLEPPELRRLVTERLQAGLDAYRQPLAEEYHAEFR